MCQRRQKEKEAEASERDVNLKSALHMFYPGGVSKTYGGKQAH